MKDVDGQTLHGCVHEEEPGGRGAVEVVLLGIEGHPRLGGAPSDAAFPVRPEVEDLRLANGAAQAQVLPHGFWEAEEIVIAHQPRRRCSSQAGAHRLRVLRPQAQRPVRREADHHPQQQKDVGQGAELGVGPRGGDHPLREHQRADADEPEPARAHHQEHRGGEHRHRSREPQQPHRARDGLRELTELREAESLDEAHEVNEPVQRQHDDEYRAHGASLQREDGDPICHGQLASA